MKVKEISKKILAIVVAIAVILSGNWLPEITVRAGEIVDITDKVALWDLNWADSSWEENGATWLQIHVNDYSVAPLGNGGSNFYVNDNPTANTIDIAQCISINGKTVRQHINDYASSFDANNLLCAKFPMNAGAVYNPILLFVDQGNGGFNLYIPTSYCELETISISKDFQWDNSSNQTLTLTKDVTWYNVDGSWTTEKPMADVDVTEDIAAGLESFADLAGTTSTQIVFGEHSILPADGGAAYYVNDNASKNGLDPASYIELNGKTIRSHINEYTGTSGTSFPMSAGAPYNPILMYCASDFFRISVLDSYLPTTSYETLTVKQGFAWNTSSGERLVLSQDVTLYWNGGDWSKTAPSSDISMNVTPQGFYESNEFYQIFLPLPTGVDFFSTIGYWGFLDKAEYEAIFDMISLNNKTLTEINAEHTGYGFNSFPQNMGTPYNKAVSIQLTGDNQIVLMLHQNYVKSLGEHFSLTLSSDVLLHVAGANYKFADGTWYNDFGKWSAEKVSTTTVSGFSVEGYYTEGNASEIKGMNIKLPSGITLINNENGDYMWEDTYSDIYDAIYLNGESLSEINAENLFTTADYSTFPQNYAAGYAKAAVVYVPAGNTEVRIKVHKDFAEKYLGDAPVLTIKKGIFSTNNEVIYEVQEDLSFWYDRGLWISDGEVKLVEKNITGSGYYEITNNDFAISDSSYDSVSSISSVPLTGKIFSADVIMSNGTTIWYGVSDVSNPSGLNLTRSGDALVLKNGNVTVETITGIDFSQAFNLKISTKIIDADGDGSKDDVKIGVWVDDILCNNEYSYINNYSLGTGLVATGEITFAATKQTINTDYYSLATLKEFGVNDADNATTINGTYSGSKNGLVFTADLTVNESTTVTYLGQNINNLPMNTPFNLKVTTDVIDADGDGAEDDVRYGVFVDDKLQENVYNYLLDTTLTETLSITGNVDIASADFVVVLLEVAYDLDDGYYLISTKGMVTVNGISKANGDELAESGDYEIRKTEGIVTYVQNVSLYRMGDADAGDDETGDGVYNVNDVNAKDLVGAKKLQQNIVDSRCRRDAADFDKDGNVGEYDLTIIRKILVDDVPVVNSLVKETDDALTKAKALYGAPSLSYDAIGGSDVMPIGGYYAPYTWARKSTDVIATDYLTDDIYQLIKGAGVNLLLWSPNDYSNQASDQVELSLQLAEKYDMGVYVNDGAISNNTDGGLITDKTSLANQIGKYSRYHSFAGIHVVDEPKDDSMNWIGSIGLDRLSISDYSGTTSLLNSYSNLTGFMNLFQNNPTYFSGDGYKEYLENYINLCNADMLSFDYYIFNEDGYASSDSVTSCADYFQNLADVRVAAKNHNIPFWSYIQTGRDFSDEGDSTDVTVSNGPTPSEMLWNINTTLAFGAKGIEYYTLIQPDYYANSSETASGYDYERSGLIGADGTTSYYYETAKTANAQIAAVDEILMRSVNEGVMATAGYATNNISGVGETYISGTAFGNVNSITSSDTTYGAMIGCFKYGEKTALYVVNYNAYGTQTVTLNFDGTHTYTVYEDGKIPTTSATGTNCTLTDMTAGEGILVVID